MYLQFIVCFRNTCVSTVYSMFQEDPCIYSLLYVSRRPVYLQFIVCFKKTRVSTVYSMFQKDPCIYSILSV